MPKQDKPSVTQRAYTLRLRGADPSDTSWRDALWRTHEAVNKSAKAFGDWLDDRSEERRVGKECRSRWSPYH